MALALMVLAAAAFAPPLIRTPAITKVRFEHRRPPTVVGLRTWARGVPASKEAKPIQMGLRTWARGVLARKAASKEVTPIGVGGTIPDVEVLEVLPDGSSRTVPTSALFSGKHVLVGLPGAFTPTCSDAHVPGFVKALPAFASLSTNVTFVTSNDRYVLAAWRESLAACTGANVAGVCMLSDADSEFSLALGLVDDFGPELGVRTARFALYIEDSIVRYAAVDEGTVALDATSAESVLKAIAPNSQRSGGMAMPEPDAALAGAVMLALAAGGYYIYMTQH
ncbi:thioredoxin-like protein [Pavlovales sp. CCMP2436]|nr:thioredoxin-like protein [Pavlovales sp. CCMP2436]|mmetsp:Transcript_2377/g.6167  ORF Transcript_2377/g.6167 Transcript_2377/m.6167 type:complete len:280 (-) Transcript_2377:100-939(-)